MKPEQERKPKTALEVTPELKKLLEQLGNGDTLSIVENGVVVGHLQRTMPATGDADFLASVELAGRFMDRYRDAYKELAK